MGVVEYYKKDYTELIEVDEDEGSKVQKLWKEIIGNPKGLRILDVGCGTGVKVEWLAKDNIVFGLEINDLAIRKAKKRGIHVIKTDIERDFPFNDKFFDIVICIQVLEHLVQPYITLKEINRVLKPRGELVVAVPNHFGLLSRINVLLGGDLYRDHRNYWKDKKFYQWNYPHARLYTYNEFKRFLNLYGFKVIEDYSGLPILYKQVRILSHFAKRFKLYKAVKPMFRPSLFSGSFIFKTEKVRDTYECIMLR